MKGSGVYVAVALVVVLTGFFVYRALEAQQPIYLLGNMEFTPLTCSDGQVPRYNATLVRFVCAHPAMVSASDPGCSTVQHIGKQWFDTTTRTTKMKICVARTGAVQWYTMLE